MNFATGLHGVWLNFIKATDHGANAFGAELLHVGANVYGAELCCCAGRLSLEPKCLGSAPSA
jgi:hypothetical protein